MSKTEILVIGRNEEILQTVTNFINSNAEWNGIGAGTDEDAIEKFHQHHFDMLLLTDSINKEGERKLLKLFTYQNPDAIILQHYGGGSGLLSNEILEALDKHRNENKPTVSFVDDAWKNAGLDIIVQ